VILLTNEMSRQHPGLNAGSLGTVVKLPQLATQKRQSGVPANELVLDQVHTPCAEQLHCAIGLRSLKPSASALPDGPASPELLCDL
jgi:hypothetical protein